MSDCSLPSDKLSDIKDSPSEWRKVRKSRKESLQYCDFCDLIEEEIADISNKLEQNAQRYNKVEEETLNDIFCQFLVQAGYEATPETSSGGHVDIYIKREADFVYLIEGKWLNSNYSNAHLWDGYNQLLTYCSGNTNQNRGMLLIYINKSEPSTRIRKWQEYLICNKGVSIHHHVPPDSRYCFHTLTHCPQTEEEYFIKSYGVFLFTV